MDLSGKSIANMTQRLSEDTRMARQFMFNRIGVNTENSDQVSYGLSAFKLGKFIREDATYQNAFTRPQDFVVTACLMTESITSAELQECVDSGLAKHAMVYEKFLVN